MSGLVKDGRNAPRQPSDRVERILVNVYSEPEAIAQRPDERAATARRGSSGVRRRIKYNTRAHGGDGLPRVLRLYLRQSSCDSRLRRRTM